MEKSCVEQRLAQLGQLDVSGNYCRDGGEPRRRPLRRLVAECDAARWARLRQEVAR